jgi:CRISPR-associated protein Cas1
MMLRRAQHIAASTPHRSASLARAFVAGKLHNVRWLLSRSARDAASGEDREILKKAAQAHSRLLKDLEKSPDDNNIIRGIEGRAAALHFDVFSRHLRPAVRCDFPFEGRNRRPPRDAINAVLSFLYALLRNDCVSALTAIGLDPFVGYLHSDRAGRESLALDLMEEFRPWVERLGITLLNRGELKSADFNYRDGGAVELGDATRKVIVSAFQKRKQEEVTHPLFQEKVRHGQLIFIQARLLARALRSEVCYEPNIFS